ncbi:MAG TPA: hypothetical protein DHU33_01100 [Firmicutes bacterium]|nr:hypothetical protein [Bacillota bacterium]
MNIFYNDNTLYVNLDEYLDDYVLNKLKKRVFNILEDYDIENIVLNIVTSNKNNYLLDDFIREYKKKFRGNLIVK